MSKCSIFILLKGGSAQKVSKLRLCISRVQKRREEIDFSCSKKQKETLNTEILMTKKSFEISKGPKVFLPTTISIRKFKVFSSSERRIIRCSIDKKGAC